MTVGDERTAPIGACTARTPLSKADIGRLLLVERTRRSRYEVQRSNSVGQALHACATFEALSTECQVFSMAFRE